MDVRRQVFRITHSLWLGPFASPERQPVLVETGVTHLLNVGEAASIIEAADGPFREVVWRPITDLERVPEESALACLAVLHRMVCQPDARVYVHCIAGWNRSPTVVWLYLIACGLAPDKARGVIEQRAPDANPGHARLVDAALVETIQQFGARSFLPHPRPEALEPATDA